MQALARAVQIAGGQAALAEKIGKKQAHIAMWFKRKKVPAEVCADIEGATDGAVKREQLRPDVFRDPPKTKRRRAAAHREAA